MSFLEKVQNSSAKFKVGSIKLMQYKFWMTEPLDILFYELQTLWKIKETKGKKCLSMEIIENLKISHNSKSGEPNVWKKDKKKCMIRWVLFNITSHKELVTRDHLQETFGGPKMWEYIVAYHVHQGFSCRTTNTKVKVVIQRSGITW
jgi:hypothetical protein